MGRVSRYRKVKRTVKEFGKERGHGRNNLPVDSHRKKGGKVQVVNGFVLEPDNNRKMLRKVQSRRGGSRKRGRDEATAAHRQAKKDDVLKSLRIAPGESLRNFDQRVEKASREVVSEQIRSQTLTAKKRKQFMKERKQRHKMKKRQKIARKIANKEDEEAELVYQGLKPFERKHHASSTERTQSEKDKNMPTRRIGVHTVAERPPEFEQKETDKKRFAKLKFMSQESSV